MTDRALAEDVVRELEWDTSVHARAVGVSVNGGAVTLTGLVSTHAEKHAALRATQRVYGVSAVADEIVVRLDGSQVARDAALAEGIVTAFRWNGRVPESVQAEVHDGWVTLRGDVASDGQRREANSAVHELDGVMGVTDRICVTPLEARP
jgi:osmotically-inducible protein OsmY